MRRNRTVSVAVGYLLLTVVVLVADAILVSSYLGFLASSSGWVPSIVYEKSQGVVYGSYMISPCQVQTRDSWNLQEYTIEVPCLHISLVNPSPVPAEAILLAHLPGLPTTYRVVDLLPTMGIYWDTPNGQPPRGVSVVERPSWFVGPVNPASGPYMALRLDPGASTSFRVPLYYSGVPSELLACTRVGCTRLRSVGSQMSLAKPTATWILSPSDQPQQVPSPQETEDDIPKYTAHQTAQWSVWTVGGRGYRCIAGHPYATITLWFSMPAPECCDIECPPSTKRSRGSEPRARCGIGIAQEAMLSPSSVYGYPPSAIVGYFSTDRNFDFVVPSTSISYFRGSYRLIGFDSRKYSGGSPYSNVVGKWTVYRYQECNRRVVNMEFILSVDPDRSVPLSVLYPRSTYAVAYVATRGFAELSDIFFGLLPAYRYDNVVIKVYAIERLVLGGRTETREIKVAEVVAERTSNYVDNRGSMVPINLGKTVGIKVEVMYTMVGEEPAYCYANFLDFTLYCGSTYDRNVRLGFYVELIPQQFFR